MWTVIVRNFFSMKESLEKDKLGHSKAREGQGSGKMDFISTGQQMPSQHLSGVPCNFERHQQQPRDEKGALYFERHQQQIRVEKVPCNFKRRQQQPREKRRLVYFEKNLQQQAGKRKLFSVRI